MPNLVFDVVCSAERLRIAELELPAGQPIDRDDLVAGYTPISDLYAVIDRNGELRRGPTGAPIIQDGVQLVCPRCYNPLLVTEPGKSEGIYLAPGAFETGKVSA